MNIRVYQINLELDDKRVKFCSLSETKSYGRINPAIYQKVFEGTVDCKNLEQVYEKFNTDCPPTHFGHALSVSDIVETDGAFYFCENTGWEKVDFDASKVPTEENNLKILVVEPQKEPYTSSVQDDYRAFQHIVGGNFECIYLDDDTVLFCNDEAKLIGLEGNRRLCDDIIAGTFFLAGDNHEGETISLTEEQIERCSAQFKEPEQFTQEEVQDTMHMEFYSY